MSRKPTMRALVLSPIEAKILCTVLTRHSPDRSLRDAKLLMDIDERIAGANVVFEALHDSSEITARQIRRDLAGDPEALQRELDLLNQGLEQVEESVRDERIRVLLEQAEANFLEAQFKAIKGVPADRVRGKLFQAILQAIEAMETVPVEEPQDE